MIKRTERKVEWTSEGKWAISSLPNQDVFRISVMSGNSWYGIILNRKQMEEFSSTLVEASREKTGDIKGENIDETIKS